MVRALLLCIALLVPGTARPAVTAGDLAEIRAVIIRQIEALRRDDAESAFALVSPAVQQTYGTPERFLDVMRTSYHPVYRPAAVTFSRCSSPTARAPSGSPTTRCSDRRTAAGARPAAIWCSGR